MMIRVIIFILVVVLFVVIGLLSMALSFRYQSAAAPSKQIALCSDEPDINNRINIIAFEALDNALRDQIGRLFSTWMKDDTGQPERAATGVKQSAVAYVHARKAILEWNIPPCGTISR